MVQYAYIPREGVVSAPGPTGAWQVNILAGASAWLAFIDETHVPRAADAWVSLFAKNTARVRQRAAHGLFCACPRAQPVEVKRKGEDTMGFAELFLIGVGLSMDVFAVAVCKGLNMHGTLNWRDTGLLALFFGGFQALMPLAGWALGRGFEQYITSIDHWIAFGLLAFIGGHMLWEVWKGEGEEEENEEAGPLRLGELTLLAIATSIDALAVGITFAFLGINIVSAISIIGCTTFVLSGVGVMVGHRFGLRYKKKAEIAGGVILILIGVKILLEHLGILA